MENSEQGTEDQSASSLIEQLGRALQELQNQKDASEDTVQWIEIREHFLNLDKTMRMKQEELQAREKEYMEKEAKTLALLEEREGAVVAKEQEFLDRVQELKDTAVAVISEARANHQPILLESIDTHDNDKNTKVRKLVEDLKSDSINSQRTATSELRLLAKHNTDNRIIIANSGAIPILVNLLRSTDTKTQEHTVTALLNLSINDNNKTAIADADAIEPLIHVLKTGSPVAKENAAATLFSLSVIEENKFRIGRSGAIQPLVDLLGNGTPRGKKDAATALFNLSICQENKGRVVFAGAVKHLVELMDPAGGMVDKAVAVLANLATIHEGRAAIGQEGAIPLLVEAVELGSARGKENAVAALLRLCTNSSQFSSIVIQEGAVPPLVALSQTGTPRAKEKAQALIQFFRSQQHANARG